MAHESGWWPGFDNRLTSFGGFLIASMLVKAALLLVDAQPRFFLGDSASYLSTALGRYLPNDRSWVYGIVATTLIRATGSLASVLWAQTLVGAFTCALVGAFAVRRLGLSRHAAWILVVVLSIDPLALYSERSVLTDTVGSALFVLSTVLLVELAHRPSIARASALAITTVLAVALRTAFVPHALVIAIVSCCLATRRPWTRKASAACAAGGLLVLAGMHGYGRLTGALIGTGPSVNPRSGAFLVGLFAPLLTPADFEGLGLRDPAAQLSAAQTQYPWKRNDQTFADDGLASAIEREVGDWRRANEIQRTAARRAMVRDPIGVARLTWANALEYVDGHLYREQFKVYTGLFRALPDAVLQRLERLTKRPMDPASHMAPSPISRWLRRNLWEGPTLFVLAWIAPVVLFPWARQIVPDGAVSLRILCVVTLAYITTVVVFSLSMAPRFLLPITSWVAILVLVGASALWRALVGGDTPLAQSRPTPAS